MPAHVTTDRPGDGLIAHITYANPAKLNVLGSAGMAALNAAFESLAGNPDLVAVVLRGEGAHAFIGGADIAEMVELTPASARSFILGLHRVCAAIRSCAVPVIARLQGYALGAGLEIAAACDLRIAAAGARFGMPEVRVGIPSVIEAALLPMLIGWGRTRRLLYGGEMIDAPTALAWGLVEEVVAEDALDEAVARLLATMRAAAPGALRQQKALMQEWEALPPAAAIGRGVDAFAHAWRHEEPRLRMRAFLERKPSQR